MKLFWLILMVLITSCSANYHLRMAIKKGAKVETDTVYRVFPFMYKGPEFSTVISPIGDVEIFRDTIKVEENGIETKIKLTPKPGKKVEDCVDTVYVETKCPDIEGEIEVPVSTTTNIESPHGFWTDFQIFVGGMVVGILCLLAIIFYRSRQN